MEQAVERVREAGQGKLGKMDIGIFVPGVVYRRLANAPDAVVDLSCIYRNDETSPLLQAFLQTIREFRGRNGGRH